jgi:Dolichyl-phosphate-mannose-protein mannosyltransferase
MTAPAAHAFARPLALALLLAVAVLGTGLRYGAMVAGGADSYGYISQAGYWQHGSVVVQEDVIRPSPWPGAALTWAPLGYRPSPNRADAIVPLYAPGLPLLMALFQLVAGFCGAFLVVPICGALTILLTYELGRRVFGCPGIALWSAALVATSPVFLYQLMNAMSDVPVTAAWTLALVLTMARRPLVAGLAMSAAIAIRPNLAPLAALLLAWTAWSTGWLASLRFTLGTAIAVIGIALLNARVYESALTSGYGTTADLYALRYLGTNLRQFAAWTAAVETPLVALAGLFFVVPSLLPPAAIPHPRLLLGGSVAIVLLSYLFYQPFDAWWYLRFLLPMWPVMMLLTAATLDAFANRWLRPSYPFAIAAMAIFLGWHGLTVAADRHAFDLGRGERRYLDVARFVAGHTEPNAVILSVQHSGSLRIYAGRLTLRYDALDPLWLDRAIAYLQSIGRRPYYVLDGAEVEAFKTRFGEANTMGTLDWRPVATLGGTIAIYDPIDRRPGESPLAIAATRGTHLLCDPPQSWPPVLRMK